MNIFRIDNIINSISYKEKYDIYEKDQLYKELIVNTDVYVNENLEKIIELKCKLKNSFMKTNVIEIDYNYSRHEYKIIKCNLCISNSFFKRYDNCCHAIYVMQKYNEGLIDGSLRIDDIDILFKSIEAKKKKEQEALLKKKMMQLLESLETTLNENEKVSSSRPVHLTPFINCKSNKGIEYFIDMELKVGIDKQYVIKDIREFLGRIDKNETYSYGKNLSFKHNVNNFDESSRKCIDILMNYTYDCGWYNIRNKELSPKANQSIIEAYQNSNIFINGEECFVLLEDYIPQISIRNGKIIFDDCDYIDLISGNEYDFILKDNKLYKLKCDNELRIFIRFIIVNKDFDIELVKEDFAKKIVSRFVDSIDLDEDFKNEFLIKELKIEAYFDYKDVISLDTKYYLDDVEISEDEVKENNFVSKKYTKYWSIINGMGFVNNEIKDVEGIGNFLTGNLDNLREHCEIFLSNNIKGMKIRKMGSFKSNISYNSGMLEVCFEDLNFTNEELNKIINGMKKKLTYIKLNKNVIFKVEEESKKQLLNIVDEFNLQENKLNEVQEVPLYQGLKLIDESNQFGNITLDEKIKEMIKDIANYRHANYPIPLEVKDVLREYQINAFNWLKTLVKYKFCGILADDMGLGKTLEIISLVLSDEEIKPSLIVSPKSLIYNWQNEFKKWAPNINVKVISGNADERKDVISTINNSEKTIYITSYDSLRNDLENYNEYVFRFCILDEAQFIKNHLTLKAQSVKQIKSEIRFVLTGTPIENTVVDLWSLFDFLMPNYLYNYKSFSVDFEKEIINKKNNSVIKKLVKKITPFILRRTKKEVLKDLPDKIETIRYAQMGEEQRKVYEAQLLKTRYLMEKEKNKIEILSALTRLRQICVNPGMFLGEYDGESAKINLLMELLEELISNKHKVLIFSQFTTIFETISEKLKEKGIDYFILTGKTPALLRVEMADIFNKKNSSQKVFLISLKAGGTGLNLVGADTVIQLDPWWNVAAENQASDRAHRIGQKNVVQVIKLICENSIEQKVLELQELKKDIINKVIADNDENIVKLNDNDLKYLLG